MNRNHSPIQLPDDGPARILIHEDWYAVFAAMYDLIDDNGFDPVFDIAVEEIEESARAVFEFLQANGELGVEIVGLLLGLIVTAARYGFRLGKFRYGGLGNSQFGNAVFGEPEIVEID